MKFSKFILNAKKIQYLVKKRTDNFIRFKMFY